MPHLSTPDATRQRPGCHTSARPKCGIYPREVWHPEGVRPFMYNHLPDKRTKRQRDKNEKTSTSSVKQNKSHMRNFHQRGIDTRGRISGKIKTICPQCNDTRGHKGNKSLSVDLDKGLCYCHHCGYKLYVPDDAEERLKQQRRDMRRKPAAPPQHFRRPTFDPARMQLSENLERYWSTVRCLPQELLRTLRITEETVRLPESSQEENCICFNYFENGTLVNTKYRSALKHFMMVKGAELIPYNVDSILGTPECIITEGEFDAAAIIAAGRKDVIPCPPAPRATSRGWTASWSRTSKTSRPSTSP